MILSREENGNLKTVGESQEKRVKDLEGRLVNAEAANNSLSRKISAFDNARYVRDAGSFFNKLSSHTKIG